jgi:uncharacterized membrane protein YuzA (DUF378 family)
MGPATQQFFFSSFDVIAATCFGHTTIIKRHAYVFNGVSSVLLQGAQFTVCAEALCSQ